MKIQSISQKIFKGLGILLVVTMMWIGVAVNAHSPYNALDNDNVLIAMDSNPINKIFGSGTTDKIEGKVEKDIATTQKNVRKAGEEMKGSLEQAKGRAKQDIGEVKNRLDATGSDLEDASEDALDAVGSFFGQ